MKIPPNPPFSKGGDLVALTPDLIRGKGGY